MNAECPCDLHSQYMCVPHRDMRDQAVRDELELIETCCAEGWTWAQ